MCYAVTGLRTVSKHMLWRPPWPWERLPRHWGSPSWPWGGPPSPRGRPSRLRNFYKIIRIMLVLMVVPSKTSASSRWLRRGGTHSDKIMRKSANNELHGLGDCGEVRHGCGEYHHTTAASLSGAAMRNTRGNSFGVKNQKCRFPIVAQNKSF